MDTTESIWNNCLKVNNELGKYRQLSLHCTNELWGVLATSWHDSSRKVEIVGQSHSTIAQAVRAFSKSLLNDLNSSIQEIDQEILNLQEVKKRNQEFISTLLDK